MGGPAELTRLGRYEIVRTLGRGAMGVVYEGRDPKLERQVAIKTILKGHLLDATLAADYSARFVREAQAVARLAHPHIVTVFDFGEQDEVAYLVMEFIHGRELAAHFEAGDFLDLPRAVQVMCELLDALAYAHERGIVHRDIKPANVMIDRAGHVKLTDFGVARLVDSNADRTMPGTMVGTPSYMSPEQIQGMAVGSRADLFAAGVILYQFLTHQRPFRGNGAFGLQKAIVHDEPVPPSQVVDGLPPAFDAVVARALAKDPADRYASAAEFADAIRHALPRVAAAAPAPQVAIDPDATVVRTVAASASPQRQAAAATLPLAQSAPGATARPRTRRWVPAALGVGLAAAGALVYLSTRPPPPPASTASPAAAAAPVPAPPAVTVAAPASAPMPATPSAPPASATEVVTTPVAASAPVVVRDVVRRSASGPPAAPAATPTNAAARAAAIRAGASRCSDLLQRVQLGDTLGPQEQEILQKECRR